MQLHIQKIEIQTIEALLCCASHHDTLSAILLLAIIQYNLNTKSLYKLV